MSGQPLKVGIVGVGNIAERHAQGYLALPDLVQIAAVADIAPAVAQAKAGAWGAPLWFTSLEEMLREADLQAVDICLPHDLHVAAVQAAVAAGKHVYIDKPLGRTAAECREVIAAVERAGVHLMVGHNLLFNPLYEKARRAAGCRLPRQDLLVAWRQLWMARLQAPQLSPRAGKDGRRSLDRHGRARALPATRSGR